VLETMKRRGTPITRDNYIRLNWGRRVPDDELTSEDEQQIPPELRE
jgi:hypothetical protein